MFLLKDFGLEIIDKYDEHYKQCPLTTFSSDFRSFRTVLLDTESSGDEHESNPDWIIYNKGVEMLQNSSSKPGLAFGPDRYAGFDFEGKVFVDTAKDDGYLGFIFGYETSNQFYVAMWKKTNKTYWDKMPFEATAGTLTQLESTTS